MERVEVHLPTGETLCGDVLPGTASRWAVVYVHGFGSHRGGEKAASLATECARRRVTFAAFDFRGHGETGGPMRALTATRLLDDLSAVRAFLADRGYNRL